MMDGVQSYESRSYVNIILLNQLQVINYTQFICTWEPLKSNYSREGTHI